MPDTIGKSGDLLGFFIDFRSLQAPVSRSKHSLAFRIGFQKVEFDPGEKLGCFGSAGTFGGKMHHLWICTWPDRNHPQVEWIFRSRQKNRKELFERFRKAEKSFWFATAVNDFENKIQTSIKIEKKNKKNSTPFYTLSVYLCGPVMWLQVRLS